MLILNSKSVSILMQRSQLANQPWNDSSLSVFYSLSRTFSDQATRRRGITIV